VHSLSKLAPKILGDDGRRFRAPQIDSNIHRPNSGPLTQKAPVRTGVGWDRKGTLVSVIKRLKLVDPKGLCQRNLRPRPRHLQDIISHRPRKGPMPCAGPSFHFRAT